MICDARYFWHRQIGRLRLFFRECPRCNSNAPEVRNCAVCEERHTTNYTPLTRHAPGTRGWPNRTTLALWWHKFLTVRTVVDPDWRKIVGVVEEGGEVDKNAGKAYWEWTCEYCGATNVGPDVTYCPCREDSNAG